METDLYPTNHITLCLVFSRWSTLVCVLLYDFNRADFNLVVNQRQSESLSGTVSMLWFLEHGQKPFPYTLEPNKSEIDNYYETFWSISNCRSWLLNILLLLVLSELHFFMTGVWPTHFFSESCSWGGFKVYWP